MVQDRAIVTTADISIKSYMIYPSTPFSVTSSEL